MKGARFYHVPPLADYSKPEDRRCLLVGDYAKRRRAEWLGIWIGLGLSIVTNVVLGMLLAWWKRG